ncbi:hypothetical protein K435DRAFT_846493 [Dendrothele bispora CBS 962.96]|uniref:Uncharacterized protein n=1 Tax=Dendrothele bispora (strain CBS 962.96) TaxID=1314807 RepID=A0A4S8KMB4_DENBC|nr:hypothetical protein K435DRAFT_846493 [Dendrothele bispora CBS 962.96]
MDLLSLHRCLRIAVLLYTLAHSHRKSSTRTNFFHANASNVAPSTQTSAANVARAALRHFTVAKSVRKLTGNVTNRKTKYICISLTQRKGIDSETPPSRYFTLENIDFVDRHDLLLDLLRGVEEHLENVIAEDTREDVVPVILTVNDLPVKCSTISLRSLAPDFYQSLRESEKMMQRDGEYGWLNRARIAGQNRGDSKDLNVVSKEVLLGQRDIIEVGRLQRRRNSDNWTWVRVEQNELPAMTGCSQQFANALIPDFSPKRHMDDFTKEFGKELSEQGVDPELMFGYMLQKLAQTQLR